MHYPIYLSCYSLCTAAPCLFGRVPAPDRWGPERWTCPPGFDKTRLSIRPAFFSQELSPLFCMLPDLFHTDLPFAFCLPLIVVQNSRGSVKNRAKIILAMERMTTDPFLFSFIATAPNPSFAIRVHHLPYLTDFL
jgi:hypothetical protein